jgi:hypothetical protein
MTESETTSRLRTLRRRFGRRAQAAPERAKELTGIAGDSREAQAYQYCARLVAAVREGQE